MNLKKAKIMRALVRELIKREIIKEPYTRYGQVKHEKQTGELTSEGAPIMREFAPRTVVLDPMSPKGVYRRMKRNSMAAVLAGKA